MTENRVKKNHKIDNIRAFAIITVVIGHSIILYSSQWGLYETERSSLILDCLKRFINLYQMPLFFSLSGYLFSRTGKNRQFIPFTVNKLRRLLLPFITIGTLWMIPVRMLVHYPYYEGNSYRFAVYKLLTGYDTGHLWYLPTLFIIFIILFLIVKGFGNRKLTWSLVLIITVLANLFRKSLPAIDGVYFPYVYQYGWSFAFGAFIYQFKADLLPNMYVRALSIGTVLSVAFTLYRGKLAFQTSALIILCVYNLISDQDYGLASKISKNSFGIYLFHSPLIYITFSHLLNAHPLLVSGINLFVFGSASYLLTEQVRKTPLKLMIGE